MCACRCVFTCVCESVCFMCMIIADITGKWYVCMPVYNCVCVWVQVCVCVCVCMHVHVCE